MRMNLGASLSSSTIIFFLFKLVPTSFAFIYSVVFMVVVKLLSHILLFGTPWTAVGQASLSFTLSQRLLKLMSFESIMSSYQLILCHPLLLLPSVFSSTRVFSSESALLISWPKYWSFSISPSNEYSGLMSFRTDWFDFFAV